MKTPWPKVRPTVSGYWRKAKRILCRGIAPLGGIPKLLASLASLGAILLAMAPGGIVSGEYDAELAVLTGTLIAVAWYAYFTFRVARSTPILEVKTGLETGRGHLHVRPQVMNPTDRRLDVSIAFGVWIDGDRVSIGDFYRGVKRVPIDPRREFTAATISLDDHVNVTEDKHGDRWIKNENCLVAIRVDWIDDLCESGETTTLHQHTDFPGSPSAVVDPDRIEEMFGDLEGYEDLFGPIERY